jgi:hypothetical protein
MITIPIGDDNVRILYPVCIKPAAIPMFLRTTVLVGAGIFFSVVNPAISVAAESTSVVNEKFTDLEPGIQMLRDEIGKDRRAVVKESMLLTESEAAKFWPIYDEYRAAQHKVLDRRVRLITDFAAHRDAMSEDEAERLTEEALAIEKKRFEVKEDYVSKMHKVLSARTVARFFQIDAKLDAIVDAGLASHVPLIY